MATRRRAPVKGLAPPAKGIGGQVPLGGPNSFNPYKAPAIPSGYYDPNLDAQRQAASRGLTNTEQDIGTAGRYARTDYDFSNAGIERDYGRGVADIATQRGYAGVDYGRNTEALTRTYKQLGRQQGEQARKYGVTSGGIALLSAAKRNENQALGQRDIDTGYQRQVAGYDTATTRLGEDRGTQLGRNTVLYDRGVGERGNALSRARTEDQFFGLDVDAQKQYQAQQNHYDAPTGPANEGVLPNGQAYRDVKQGNYIVRYDRNGQQISRRRAR